MKTLIQLRKEIKKTLKTKYTTKQIAKMFNDTYFELVTKPYLWSPDFQKRLQKEILKTLAKKLK